MRIFIDTEFTRAPEGITFLSLGIVSDAGHRLYSERPVAEVEALLARQDNDFVRTHVLPQFNRLEGVPWHELPARFATWLDQLGPGQVDVIYDYSGDYALIEHLLMRMDKPPRTQLVPTIVGYLLHDPAGQNAAEGCWQALNATMGVGQHHAFADAVALRSRFEAVHPSTPADVERKVLVMDAVVTDVIEMFEVVHADTADGEFTLCLGDGVEGVDWRTLKVGQRVRCRFEAGHSTRVLSAVVLP